MAPLKQPTLAFDEDNLPITCSLLTGSQHQLLRELKTFQIKEGHGPK